MRGCSLLVVLSLVVLSLAHACVITESEPVGEVSAQLGEPTDGFPNWQERVLHVWTNRARVDPATDLASCTVCPDSGCYSPVAPMIQNHELTRLARFHSDHLVRGGCGLQHDSPCDLVSNLGSQYTPGPCNGDPSCACDTGTHGCGSVGTIIWDRFARFSVTGGARAENIARGRSDPVDTFYQWLHEPHSSATCVSTPTNGHRWSILSGNYRSIGNGKAQTGNTWTQDFWSNGTVDGLVGGVHYPQTGSSLDFRANWHRSGAPTTAQVNIDGTCSSMSLERGTAASGTYLANVSGLGGGCIRYYFHFTQGSENHFFPTTGAYGINCGTDWEAARPTPCGACTPDCSGRMCGDDGCGGSCGTCAATRTCSAAGQCDCSGTRTECGASCVLLDRSRNHCGACNNACAANEDCVGGACQCVPDCTGRMCGDDGCGGSCGSCGAMRVCGAGGSCMCSAGLDDCGGNCTDVRIDEANCGSCANACTPAQTCLAGSCMDAVPDAGCVPACAGRDCGDDTCGGSCGACSSGEVCGAGGVCVCGAEASDCDGACVDVRRDRLHCGACGAACEPGWSCSAGECVDDGAGGVDSGLPPPPGRDAGSISDPGVTPLPPIRGECACSAPGDRRRTGPGAWVLLGVLVAGWSLREARRTSRLR